VGSRSLISSPARLWCLVPPPQKLADVLVYKSPDRSGGVVDYKLADRRESALKGDEIAGEDLVEISNKIYIPVRLRTTRSHLAQRIFI